MTATTPKSRKAKGRSFQNYVAEKIRGLLNCHPDDVRPTLMGERGTDIKLSPAVRDQFPFAVECKAVDKLDLWGSLRQAEFNANLTGRHPLLVFKASQEKKLRSKAYAVLPFETVLALMEVVNCQEK